MLLGKKITRRKFIERSALGTAGLAFTGHVQNFVDCIRTRGRTRCNEDDAFEEAVTCMMSTIAYKEKRQVSWDPVREEIV